MNFFNEKDKIAYEEQATQAAIKQMKEEEEMLALEEKLGVDGIKPSQREQFYNNGVTGTTAYNAFAKPTIRGLKYEKDYV